MSLIKWFSIAAITNPLSAVLVLGLWPWCNTADLGPVTRPISSNFLITFDMELYETWTQCFNTKMS